MTAFTTLVDTATLADRVADPEWVVVDCRFALDDVAWGERAYAAGHVPGAVYAHLDRDLSGPKTGTNGRHPLPSATVAAAAFGRLGIGAGTQVVAYDQDCGMFAPRLWWLLRWLGHDLVAVLDGGWAKWIAEGRPAQARVAARPARTFVPAPRPEMVVDAGQVAALAADPAWRLVDARAPERFRGEVEPIDPVAGHIPGATNHPPARNLGAAGTYRAPQEMRGEWSGIVAGVPAAHVVSYCGSGVSACQNLLALEHAGHHGARLYPGSWSEWVSDPRRPVALGEQG